MEYGHKNINRIRSGWNKNQKLENLFQHRMNLVPRQQMQMPTNPTGSTVVSSLGVFVLITANIWGALYMSGITFTSIISPDAQYDFKQ